MKNDIKIDDKEMIQCNYILLQGLFETNEQGAVELMITKNLNLQIIERKIVFVTFVGLRSWYWIQLNILNSINPRH